MTERERSARLLDGRQENVKAFGRDKMFGFGTDHSGAFQSQSCLCRFNFYFVQCKFKEKFLVDWEKHYQSAFT